MYLYIWMTTLNLGMLLYTCYFICSDIFIYISINTKYKCWWLVRFEDVYKFIRGHRLSLGGSPRSPPFYFPIFIEPMNCFPRSQSQIFLEYSEHLSISMFHNISLYFPWIVFQQVNHRYFQIFRIFRTFVYISLSHLCWAIELFSRKSIMGIFVKIWQFRIFRLIRIFHCPMLIEPIDYQRYNTAL